MGWHCIFCPSHWALLNARAPAFLSFSQSEECPRIELPAASSPPEAATGPFRAAPKPVQCHLAARGVASDRPTRDQARIMKCLACSAEMLLTEVCPDRTTVCGIERHTFRCSACGHTAKRLMLNRSRAPITNLPAVIPPKAPIIDPPTAVLLRKARGQNQSRR